MQVIAKQSDQNNNPDEQGSPEKKRKASASTEQDTKKKKWKKSKAEPEPVAAAAPARSSKTIDQAKRICKQATIKIPPTTYAKSKSLAELEADLEDLLSKHGLSLDASSQYIEKVRRK